MEYLMTYGWAILIIAVVLGAMFSLGLFGGAGVLSTTCIADSGFLCQNLLYSHTTGNLIVTVGQYTGLNWGVAAVEFVPQGTPTNSIEGTLISNFHSTSNSISFSIDSPAVVMQYLQNGGEATLTLPVSAPHNTLIGSTVSGTIWVAYFRDTSGLTQFGNTYIYVPPLGVSSQNISYQQMATVTLKAV
jgi:hypothetical protein